MKAKTQRWAPQHGILTVYWHVGHPEQAPSSAPSAASAPLLALPFGRPLGAEGGQIMLSSERAPSAAAKRAIKERSASISAVISNWQRVIGAPTLTGRAQPVGRLTSLLAVPAARVHNNALPAAGDGRGSQPEASGLRAVPVASRLDSAAPRDGGTLGSDNTEWEDPVADGASGMGGHVGSGDSLDERGNDRVVSQPAALAPSSGPAFLALTVSTLAGWLSSFSFEVHRFVGETGCVVLWFGCCLRT